MRLRNKALSVKATQDRGLLRDQHLEYKVAGDGKTIETKSGAFIAYCGSRAMAQRVMEALNLVLKTGVPTTKPSGNEP
jgi:hypothetical protein